MEKLKNKIHHMEVKLGLDCIAHYPDFNSVNDTQNRVRMLKL